MKLQDKQFEFTRDISRLIRFTYSLSGDDHPLAEDWDIALTFSRAYASDPANEADGGIPGSCHTMRLAVDFNLFVNGEYITEFHPVWHVLGRFWKSLNTDENRWGGDFRSKDFNHFSRRHNGKQ